jgi:L,D-transpeptidase ErfK/SrfK
MPLVFGAIFCENSAKFAGVPDIDTFQTRIRLVLTAMLVAVITSGCAIFEGWEPLETPSAKLEKPLQERPRLDPINRNYFVLETSQQSVIGQPQIVFTREENTFSDLAREYGLGYDEIVAANPDIDPWLPGDGTPVILPTQYVLPDVARKGVVLNIASKRLFYFPEVAEGEPVKVMTYPIGIGRVGWETPLGETTVVSKALNPHWYVPASVRKEHAEMGDPLPSVVLPGPDNPLGNHVLKLGLPGYLIHGTNQPYGVGMRVSHGCVRLYPENIELLYSLVGVGEDVQIINEPYLAGMLDDRLYFEAHLPLEDDVMSPEAHLQKVFASYESLGDESVQITARAIAADANGVPVPVLSHGTTNLREYARLVRNTVERDPNAPTLAEVRALLDEPEVTD